MFQVSQKKNHRNRDHVKQNEPDSKLTSKKPPFYIRS